MKKRAAKYKLEVAEESGFSGGLYYFTIYDSTIHDPTMANSFIINYPHMLKLCKENYVTGKQYFAEELSSLSLHANKYFLAK